MLYDAQGRPYVEPPLLPESLIVHNIVKDYQRMFLSYDEIKSRLRQLERQNAELTLEVHTLRQTAQQRLMLLRYVIRYIKRSGLKLTKKLNYYGRQHFPDLL